MNDWREKAKAYISNVSVKAEPIERDAWLVQALAALDTEEKRSDADRNGWDETIGDLHALRAWVAKQRCANAPKTFGYEDCGICPPCLEKARKP